MSTVDDPMLARPAHNGGMPAPRDSRINPRKMKFTQRSPLLRNISYLLAIDEHRNFTRAPKR
jgi:LysR family cyn operon transcriptional activator